MIRRYIGIKYEFLNENMKIELDLYIFCCCCVTVFVSWSKSVELRNEIKRIN